METITTSKPVNPCEDTNVSSRQQPIPPPSHPRQYRAIGLIQAQYTPSEEKIITRGNLVTSDGITIDAVILGKVISLIKNHVDFSQSYLWVVYPRTRQENERLHAQIVGIWSPKPLEDSDNNLEENNTLNQEKSGYFSIRGEVIHYSPEDEKVIVKIRQSPKFEGEKPQFFKLELSGKLEDKGVGYFWDFQVKLQGTTFLIETATNMGRLLPQKKQFNKLKTKQDFKAKKSQVTERPDPKKSFNHDLKSTKASSKANPLERPKRKI